MGSTSFHSRTSLSANWEGAVHIARPCKRVIYVEDNAVNVALMEALLEMRGGIALECFTTGEEAIAGAARQPADLLLIDMLLPDMDGVQLLGRLRALESLRRAPAIIVSASTSPDDKRRAADAGFFDYWVKPLDVEATMIVLDRLFGRADASASTFQTTR